METEKLKKMRAENGPRNTIKQCIETGEHKKGKAYGVGRGVGVVFLWTLLGVSLWILIDIWAIPAYLIALIIAVCWPTKGGSKKC